MRPRLKTGQRAVVLFACSPLLLVALALTGRTAARVTAAPPLRAWCERPSYDEPAVRKAELKRAVRLIEQRVDRDGQPRNATLAPEDVRFLKRVLITASGTDLPRR